MREMVWNVYYEDFNRKKIEQFNIFDHGSFNAEVKKAYSKYKNDFEKFSEAIDINLRYYFWSKCEWEIILSPWAHTQLRDEIEIIIDVYDQVKMNWDIFIKYVWEQCHARKTKSK